MVQKKTWTQSEKSKAEGPALAGMANLAMGHSSHAKYTKSKSMAHNRSSIQPCGGGSAREILDIKRVNDFLRLLIINHQRTVKQLAKNPEEKNPVPSTAVRN